MTREEAILHMTIRREELKNSVGDLDEDIKAFDMAIKALEQEHCKECISREAILKLFATHDGKYLYEAIRDMPSVEQEPKIGHWIIHNESITLLTGETATGSVICSECGYKTHNKAHVMCGCPYKYCPNCGAKMEGGE